MEVGGLGYLGIFVCSAALALLLTPLALRVALRRGVVDSPGGYKTQASPIPYLGGVAIVVAFSTAVLLAAVLVPPVAGRDELMVTVGLAVALSVLGLVDDLRGLSPWLRLAVEIGAGVGLWWVGSGVLLFEVDGLNVAFTVVWVVVVTNAFNLLDNMDGLSAGAAVIAAAWFFVIAAVNGQFLVASLAVALAGCALGFLRHNRHPARIYMGDAGSLFLGFMLAAIGIRLRFDGPTEVTFFVPVLVVGVALFDTVLVTVNRLTHRRSVMQGGRDHTSHRLVFVGIPVRGAVALTYAAGIVLGWLALITSRVDRVSGFLMMGLALTASLFLGAVLSMVPVYETSRRRHLMIAEVVKHDVEPVAPPNATAVESA